MAFNYLYKHGLPFSQVLADNVKYQIENRIKNNLPSLIILDGGQGQGKTTLGVEIADYINSCYGLPPIDLELKNHPQIARGGNEFIKHFNLCQEKKYPVLIYDEAGEFSKTQTMSRFNHLMTRRFETIRSGNMIVILILPSLLSLAPNLFTMQIVRFTVHVEGRELTLTHGNFSGFSLYEINWVRWWSTKLPSAISYMAYKKCTPNFRGHFLNLPPDREKQLDKLSTTGKKNENLAVEIRIHGLLDYENLAKRYNKSVIWVKKQVSGMNLPTRKINQKKFFEKDAIRILDNKIFNNQNN